jgi:hypothetical protein
MSTTNRRATIVMDGDLVLLVERLVAEHPYSARHQLLRCSLRRGLRLALKDATKCRAWLAEDARERQPAPLVAR